MPQFLSSSNNFRVYMKGKGSRQIKTLLSKNTHSLSLPPYTHTNLPTLQNTEDWLRRWNAEPFRLSVYAPLRDPQAETQNETHKLTLLDETFLCLVFSLFLLTDSTNSPSTKLEMLGPPSAFPLFLNLCCASGSDSSPIPK